MRLWPGFVAVLAYWAVVLGIRFFAPGTLAEFHARYHGPMALSVLVAIWWIAFSRFRRWERAVVLASVLAAGLIVMLLGHASFSALAILVFCVPWLLTDLVACAFLANAAKNSPRRVGVIVAGVLGCAGVVCLLRLDGIYSNMTSHVSGRWTPTREESLLQSATATADDSGKTAAGSTEVGIPENVPFGSITPEDWPQFRGPKQNSRVVGAIMDIERFREAPAERWRKPIGPGWSSFAVVSGYLFTQEQRGESEMVICYDADDGRLVWAFRDEVRREDAVAGTGPRGTPTFRDGRIYALGSTGRLHCLEARTGARIWTRDIQKETGAKPPMYGYSGSPTVAEGMVAVFAGGTPDKCVVACRAEDGEPAWMAGEGLLSYSTVQHEVFDGVSQFLCSTNAGVTAYEPTTGRILWSNDWPVELQARIVQPQRLEGNRILIGTGMNYGIRLLEIVRDGDRWAAKEVWTSNDFKPYYSDFVIRDNVIYGFDNALLSAFDLKQKKRLWKKRGYDSGQVLLLEEPGLLITLSEAGEAAVLKADPRKPEELARWRAFSGKSWSHPVVANGRLFVRNSEEAVCYDLK